ncbi:MAG: 2Fe-2S iron-sulfur cluster binding domain-containing protein [Spirochaetaceae bacterium]|nr:2Fe-2S iron-sulfur cluster binding domain-containing protein [Spirochaetaceae bacterium]MBO5236402.1 2Fe-2S iron-sulfur cluster binding domain-containing protein [Spirochaetaceae bacterium]
MKIPIHLNQEQKILEADPSEKLINVLRREGLISVKCGCTTGICGACTVLLDNKAIPSCIIPVAAIRGSKVETLEYFSKTEEYKIITDTFSALEIKLCGYCDAGKIFAAYELMVNCKEIDSKKVYDTVKYFNCGCTETNQLVKAIIEAITAWKSQKRR